MIVNKILKSIYIELDRNNIRYSVLRRYTILDDDIDLMLFKEDLKKIDKIMEGYNAVKVDSLLYAPHIQYHIPYIECDIVKYIIIDCIFDFIFGKNINTIKVRLDKKEFIYTMIKTDDGYFMPSHEYATIFLALHIFIERKSSIDDKRFDELIYYFNKSNQATLSNIVKKIYINNQRINIFNIKTVENIFKNISAKDSKAIFYFLKISSYMKRKFIIRKGGIISFIGVDGTGKSTLCDSVFEALKLNTDNLVEIVYLGEKKSSEKLESLKYEYRKKINKNNSIFKLLKISMLFLYLIKRLILSYKLYLKSKNKYLLNDRFILDRLIPSPNTKRVGLLHIQVLKLFNNFIVSPDIIYFLSGDAKKIASRKEEYSYEDTLNGMRFQKKILEASNIKFKNLNTTIKSIEELRNDVLIDIFNRKRGESLNA